MDRFQDSPLIANLISAYMRSIGEDLFTTHTVGELLWGYEDGLLKALKVKQPDLDDVFGLFYKVSYKHIGYLFIKRLKGPVDNCRKACILLLLSVEFLFVFFSCRATLPTMANTSSTPERKTTKTLLEWIHGTMEGHCLSPPLANKTIIISYFVNPVSEGY